MNNDKALSRPVRSAALVIIGDEILSAKVRDENSPFLVREFRRIGVAVRRVVILPDDVEEIGREVRSASRRHDYVVTTGGVGPTHDDRTMEAVARGFGVRLLRHAGLEQWLKEWYGDRINEAALKMADLPEGARILQRPGLRFPPVIFRNVYILPGVPRYLRNKFEAIAGEFEGTPVDCRRLYVAVDETEIAAALNEVVRAFPDVMIGSYPVTERGDFRVMLTLESSDSVRLSEAERVLTERLGPYLVQPRTE